MKVKVIWNLSYIGMTNRVIDKTFGSMLDLFKYTEVWNITAYSITQETIKVGDYR